MSFKKLAVVTGANKGVGFALVEELCAEFNGTVYLTSRDEARGRQATKTLENQGFRPSYHQLDISDPKSIQQFCEHIKSLDKKVDLLINNAGILFLNDSQTPKLTQAELTINVNFNALVNFTHAMLPLMEDGGKIINISSSSGHLSRIPSVDLRTRFLNPNLSVADLNKMMMEYIEAVRDEREAEKWGTSPYVVSKVGVNAFTFILHRQLSTRGISVNCVHPGYVQSDMTRGVGSVTPQQGAQAVLRLVSGHSGSGRYVWHDGSAVPWDGTDPRRYIDGRDV